MHLKLERAMYVKLIVSSLSPTPNFQQKLKKTILLDFSCINRLVERLWFMSISAAAELN